MTDEGGWEQLLTTLRRRADDDFHNPPEEFRPGRHTADLVELGLRVTLTRSRYPNRPDGVDQYAVTIARIGVDGPPGEVEVRLAMVAAFGDAGAATAQARAGGRAIRMFRVAAGS